MGVDFAGVVDAVGIEVLELAAVDAPLAEVAEDQLVPHVDFVPRIAVGVGGVGRGIGEIGGERLLVAPCDERPLVAVGDRGRRAFAVVVHLIKTGLERLLLVVAGLVVNRLDRAERLRPRYETISGLPLLIMTSEE